MNEPASEAAFAEDRILILAPTANDAALTAKFLSKQNLQLEICGDIGELCRKVEEGCGALLIAEESLSEDGIQQLVKLLGSQPPWSDLPITIITSGGEVSQHRLRRLGVFGPGGNVTLLERPFRPTTLTSAAEAAIRARRRQREVQRLLEELKASEERIKNQANLFDATLSNIPDLVYSFDGEGRVLYANDTLLKLWGKTLPEVAGKNVFDLGYPSPLAEKLHDQLLSVISTGKPVRDEVVYDFSSAPPEIHDYIFNPAFDSQGNVVAVVGTTRIVTEHRKAEGAMRHLAAIVESSEDAIISKGLDGIIRTWNEGARRLFGYEAEEVIGRSIMIIIPDERRDEETTIIEKISRGERVDHFETVRRRKDGSLVPISLTISPIKDASGKVIGASKIARDITAQKAAELALRKAKNTAEAASRAKDHFLAVLSHELRTPLTPALVTVGMLERDPALPDGLRQDMAFVRRNIELETKLIDDLLDISRITAGKLKLHLQPVDLNGAVREVCRTCEEAVAQKRLRLRLDLDANAGATQADSARLQQVLWNLLKNAVKFSRDDGEIRVATGRTRDGGVRVSVSDSGAGIAPEVLPRIFNAFEQGGERITKQFGGMGLGLAISKGIVDLHHGRIFAESAGEGRGSTFTIELPAAGEPSQNAGSPMLDKVREKPVRILLVEDHADTAAALTRFFERMGYAMTRADSMSSALLAAERQTFDLVLSDLGLPDASGCDLMRKLREVGITKGIAMSGFGMDEDVRRSRDAGFSEHLVKPVDLSSIQAAIQRVLS